MAVSGKTILITGTYGFLGRNLARIYSNQGANIVGIGHGNFTSSELKKYGINKFYSDDVNLSNLINCCKNPDKIIHCASGSSVPYSIVNPGKDFERSINSTISILEYMRVHARDAKLVIPSSAAVYGQKSKMPISINDSLKPVSPYGNSKKLIESLSIFYANFYKLKISILRFFSLYGAGLKKQILWDACKKCNSGDYKFSGTGFETRDLIHIKDAASLILLAFKNASHNPPIVNGGSGQSITIKELLSFLYKKKGSNNIPIFSGEERKGDPIYFEANIKEALEWGWRPKLNWKEGVANYVEWFENQ